MLAPSTYLYSIYAFEWCLRPGRICTLILPLVFLRNPLIFVLQFFSFLFFIFHKWYSAYFRARLWIQAVFRIFIYLYINVPSCQPYEATGEKKNTETDHERHGKTMQYEYNQRIINAYSHTNGPHSNSVHRHTMAVWTSTYFTKQMPHHLRRARIFHTDRWMSVMPRRFRSPYSISLMAHMKSKNWSQLMASPNSKQRSKTIFNNSHINSCIRSYFFAFSVCFSFSIFFFVLFILLPLVNYIFRQLQKMQKK